MVVSTPPRLVAGTSDLDARAQRIGGIGAAAHDERDHRTLPGIPDLGHRRMGAQPLDEYAALRCIAWRRMGIVRKPRKARKASSAPGVAPWKVRACCNRSYTASSVVTHRPINKSLWPPMNFVPLCNDDRRAVFERPLQQRSGERRVDHHRCTGGPAGDGDCRQVGDVERRIGRCLDPHDIRTYRFEARSAPCR